MVDVLSEKMGKAFPELKEQKQLIENVIKEEEASFLRTLDQGLVLLNRIIETTSSDVISGKKAFELNNPGEMLIDGQMNLLLDSHFHKQSSVRSLIDAFNQKSEIMKILDDSMRQKGVHIFIGNENDFEHLQGCSLIMTSYRNNQNVLGSIGVVGPTSMDYKRIISMVEYTAKILSETITERSYD